MVDKYILSSYKDSRYINGKCIFLEHLSPAINFRIKRAMTQLFSNSNLIGLSCVIIIIILIIAFEQDDSYLEIWIQFLFLQLLKSGCGLKNKYASYVIQNGLSTYVGNCYPL